MSDEERVAGVTCHLTRSIYYSMAFSVSFSGVVVASSGMWLEMGYSYAIMGGATLAYFGMVIRCLFNDVPVPKYRMGDGAWVFILWGEMIYCYFTSNYCEDNAEALCTGIIFLTAGLPLLLLHWPPEDFTSVHVANILVFGILFGYLCVSETFSIYVFILLLVYPALINTLNVRVFERELLSSTPDSTCGPEIDV